MITRLKEFATVEKFINNCDIPEPFTYRLQNWQLAQKNYKTSQQVCIAVSLSYFPKKLFECLLRQLNVRQREIVKYFRANDSCVKGRTYTDQNHHKNPSVKVIRFWILKIIVVITKFSLILIQRMLFLIYNFPTGHYSLSPQSVN